MVNTNQNQKHFANFTRSHYLIKIWIASCVNMFEHHYALSKSKHLKGRLGAVRPLSQHFWTGNGGPQMYLALS